MSDVETKREKDERQVKLSEREMNVLNLAVSGLSNDEIGKKLDISRRTVDYYMGNVYLELRVSSRMEAIKRAVELGVIPKDLNTS